ncbi:MAG: DUF5979 domain-containing protein, partial [Allosphingosinicella sp.]
MRFTFTQVDAQGDFVQWENPTNPRQDVPVLVQRRAELRTGGEVPSDRSDLAAAPGEDAPGEFTNDIDVFACAILDTICESEDPDNPSIVQAEASDTISYQHLPSAVTIEKTPPTGAEVLPGSVIPYTIAVTNDGEWPIENPVITDTPDAGLLQLDPDAGEDGPYAYAVTGTAQGSTGLPMPTDAADVAVTVVGDAYTFRFADGTNLEVGQTYTITIDMVTVPGVPAGTVIGNAAEVSGDRIFDECNGLGPATATCADDIEVEVLAAGAARSGKLVRTLDSDLGQFDSVSGEDCGPVTSDVLDPADEGFFTATCVPISEPGGVIVWRFAIANTGNIPMDRVMLMDRIPVVGDTGVISTIGRGSQWSPIFIPGSIEVVNRPSASWDYLVTTGDLCTADLAVTDTAACAEDDWVDVTEVADPADITGVELLLDLSSDPLEPGDVLLVDALTYTPAVSETAGTNTIAWNTVATGAHVTLEQSNGTQDMAPIEGTKTGAALATGDLEVEKTVSGPGASFAPDPMTVTLQCISAVDTPVETALDPITLQLSPGVAETVEDLPYGAECELVEGDNGQISSSGTIGDVVGPDNPEGADVGQATLDNYYELAGLTISKTVESDAADQDGTPIEYGPFAVAVTCTFVGQTVLAEGYFVSPMLVSVDQGDPATLTGLPANSSCIVTETDTDGAAGSSTTATNGEGDVSPTSDTSVTIVLTPDDENALTNTVAFDNVFGSGSLLLEKVVTPADSPFADGPYLVQVDCTLDGDSTWSGEVSLGPDPENPAVPSAEQIDDLASGSVCTVVETADGNATSTVIDTSPATIGIDDVVEVTVTNSFDEGSATVTKAFDGDSSWADSSYEVTIRCIDLGSGALFIDIPGGAVRTHEESNAFTTTYERLPAGAYCILDETDPGNAAASEIYDDATGEPVSFWAVQGDVERSFTVVNTFEVGAINVTKESSGEGAGLWDDAEFTVSLSCTAEIDGVPTQIEIPGGATRTLSVGEMASYDALPPGAECTIVEALNGGASSSTITPNNGEIVVGGPEDTVEVTVDNTFDVGEIVVTKELSGDAAEWAVTGSFEIGVSCTWEGAAIEIPGGSLRTLSVANAFTTTYEDLPDGAACTVSETDDQGAADVVITPEGGAVIVEPGAALDVTVDNRFDDGAIELTKTVESDAVDAAGAPIVYGPFEITVECSFLGAPVWGAEYTGSPMVVSITDGPPVVITEIPTGSACTAAETDTDGAAGVAMTGSTGDGDIVPSDETGVAFVVTTSDGENPTVFVDAVNSYTVGSLALVKEIDPIDSPFDAGPYVVGVSCVLDGSSTWLGEAVFAALSDDPATADDETDFAVTIDDVATGSVCSFEETDMGYANESLVSPESVVVGAGDTAEITVTNTYLEGAVTVQKVLEGDTYWAPETFAILIACTDPDAPERVIEIPGGADRTLDESNGFATTYSPLPVGAVCELTETDDGYASSVEFQDANGDPITSWTVAEDDDLQFTLVNTFATDQIEVTKVASGSGAELWATDTFTVSLSCTWNGEPIEIPGGADRDLVITDDPATAVAVYDELPPGAECAITEPDTGGASSVTVTPNDGVDPTTGVVTVGDGDQPVAVTVDNTFAIGEIVVDKTLSGDAADWAVTGSFDISLSCTWNGGSIEIPGGAGRTLSVANSFATEYEDLPDGAECVVVETDDQGAADVMITPAAGAVVVEPGASVDVTVDNRFDDGAIALTKTVESDAVDAAGEPILYGPFELTVECAFLGAPVWGAGYSASPMIVSIAAGEIEIDELPAGSECTVAETDSDGAADVSISGTTASGDITASDESGVTFIVSPLAEGVATVAVDVVNTFDVGSLTIDKAIDPLDSPFAAGPYTVEVSCALDGDSTWAGDVVFDAASDDPATVDDETDFTVTIDDIATGSTCSFDETDMGYADDFTISPSSVVIGSGDTAVVTVTNTYLEGAVTVTKVLEGDTYWAPASFAILIDCADPDFPDRVIEIPGGAERTLDESNGFATTYSPLPVGAVCELAETDDGHASSVEFQDADGAPVTSWTVTEEDDLQFTLVNTFVTDQIEVTKVASGEGAELWGTDTFEVHLDCLWNGEPIEIPGGADRTVSAGEMALFDQLPPGAECTVTEPDTGGASSFTVTPNDGEDITTGVVTVGDGDDPVAVTIDNTFDVGEIVVTKE